MALPVGTRAVRSIHPRYRSQSQLYESCSGPRWMRDREVLACTCVKLSRAAPRSRFTGQRDDSATVKIETAAYGAITAAHERVLRARLSPHRQDCVDFGRTLARSSPAAEKEELLRAVGAVTPLARPSRWQRWSVRRCARARALLNGVMCSQARTRELVVGASHRERALLSEARTCSSV